MELFIAFDGISKTQTFHNTQKFKEKLDKFKIGELLIDFIEFDFSEYEKKRLLIESNFNNPQGMVDKINNNQIDFVPGYTIYNGERKDVEYIKMLSAMQLIHTQNQCPLYFLYIATRSYKLQYDSDYLIRSKLNFLELQDSFKYAIDFCLNVDRDDFIKDLNIKQRFFLYNHLEKGINFLENNSVASSFLLQPILHHDDNITDIFYDTALREVEDKYFHTSFKTLTKEMVDRIKKIDPTVSECYTFKIIDDICFLEFMKMVQLDIGVKKCRNCGKYFVLTDNYNTEYCERVPNGEVKTCKEIGAIRKYARKVKKDPILEAYNRAYKTHHARIKYKKMTEHEFKLWTYKAVNMKEKVKANDISLEEFIKWLKI